MIKVKTRFRGTFIVKEPKKIEHYKKLAERNSSIIIKEMQNGKSDNVQE